MASTISEYLVKAASYHSAKAETKEKFRVLGSRYRTLAAFKIATPEYLQSFQTAEGDTQIEAFSRAEITLLKKIQDDIDATISTEANFIKILTRRFIQKQLEMLNDININKLNTNPLLCNALRFASIEDLVKFNVYSFVTRSIVTSMGGLIENLLLFSSPDVFNGKQYEEGENVKWDLVVERLGVVQSFIEVKSGPNDLDKGQVILYSNEIKAVEGNGSKGYIGISYGKRSEASVSLDLFERYLPDWQNKTLIGSELWAFVSNNENYHELLMERIRETSELILQNQSIISIIDSRVTELTEEFVNRYGSIEDYLNQLW